MAEPSTTAAATTLTVISVSLLGPVLGPYALIVVCAISGAMWPVSAVRTASDWDALKLMFRLVLTAVVLTVTVAQVIERMFDFPASWSLGAVAFCLAALGNGWRPVFGGLAGALRGALGQGADR